MYKILICNIELLINKCGAFIVLEDSKRFLSYLVFAVVWPDVV